MNFNAYPHKYCLLWNICYRTVRVTLLHHLYQILPTDEPTVSGHTGYYDDSLPQFPWSVRSDGLTSWGVTRRIKHNRNMAFSILLLK